MLLYFDLNKGFKAFLEVVDHNELIEGSNSAKLY